MPNQSGWFAAVYGGRIPGGPGNSNSSSEVHPDYSQQLAWIRRELDELRRLTSAPVVWMRTIKPKPEPEPVPPEWGEVAP